MAVTHRGRSDAALNRSGNGKSCFVSLILNPRMYSIYAEGGQVSPPEEEARESAFYVWLRDGREGPLWMIFSPMPGGYLSASCYKSSILVVVSRRKVGLIPVQDASGWRLLLRGVWLGHI